MAESSDLVVGTRWYWGGRHYTVLEATAARVCLVPDAKPGVPRRKKWCDWIERDRIATLQRDGRIKPSGGPRT